MADEAARRAQVTERRELRKKLRKQRKDILAKPLPEVEEERRAELRYRHTLCRTILEPTISALRRPDDD